MKGMRLRLVRPELADRRLWVKSVILASRQALPMYADKQTMSDQLRIS
jgi:hypothetical protein